MATDRIQRLLPRHFKIMDLELQGRSKKEIAKLLGIKLNTVSLVSQSPLYQDRFAKRRRAIEKEHDQALASTVVKARDAFEQSSLDAAMVHIEALNSEDIRTAQLSANQILDRVGIVKPVEKREERPIVALNVEQLNLLNVALQESRG